MVQLRSLLLDQTPGFVLCLKPGTELIPPMGKNFHCELAHLGLSVLTVTQRSPQEKPPPSRMDL